MYTIKISGTTCTGKSTMASLISNMLAKARFGILLIEVPPSENYEEYVNNELKNTPYIKLFDVLVTTHNDGGDTLRIETDFDFSKEPRIFEFISGDLKCG